MRSLNLLYLFLFFLLPFSSPYSLVGNLIFLYKPLSHFPIGSYLQDLESNIASEFLSDAGAWSVSPGLIDGVTKVSFCYNSYLLGGYNIMASPQGYFMRTYSGLPGHNMVRFSFLAQPVDSWDGASGTWSGDTFQLQFDNGAILWGWLLNTYGSWAGPNLCGTTFVDYPAIRTVVDFQHSSGSLNLKVYSHFDQPSNDESFGFRDINMLFYTSTASPLPTNSYCGITSFSIPSPYCPCPSSRAYMSPAQSGTCYPCHWTCASCSGEYDYQCTSCDKGRYLTGASVGYCYTCDPSCVECTAAGPYKCTACVSGKYLIPDGHCDVDCYLPLVITTNVRTDLCILPAACASNYLYWDATCALTCNFPLIPIIVDSYFHLCTYNCPEEQYLYWDGTCHTDCPSPLTKRTTQARLFCDWTCSSGSGIFLYWDGVCGTTCAFPLSYHSVGVGSGYVKYICDYACTSLQYLYWNGSCIDNCLIPLTTGVTHGSNLCNFPCSPVTNIAYWDGSCSATCLPPRIVAAEGSVYVRYFCRYPCAQGEFAYWNGTCASECVPPLTYSLLNGKWFCNYPCSSGQFLQWDGTCQSSCVTPYVVRVEAGLYYCDFPCSMSNEYLYWNGSCLSYCNSPLQVTTQAAARFCNFPCTTTTTYYLYWDGTCSAVCNSPLVKVTEGNPSMKYCIYPCSSDGYLYWNGSCGSTCPIPFVASASVGKNYCKYPCTSTQYLYWNGSCFGSCNLPLAIRVDNVGALYCDFPCSDATDYLYWDGTCLETCSSPLWKQTQSSGVYARKFCYFGCSGSTPYLYWNGTCGAACDYPFKSETYRGQLFCKQPCDDETEYYYEDSKTCKASCPSPYIIDTTYSFNRCLSPDYVKSEGWFVRNILTAPASEGAVTLVNVVKMMQWIKYFDINMPPRLQKFALSQGRNVLSLKIGWTMPEIDQLNYVKSSLPAVFERHGFPSGFLVNYWQYFTTMFLVILAAILFTILEKAAKIYNQPTWQSIFETLRALTRWSTLLILISTSIDDVVLFSSFQLKTLSASASSDYTILGFLVSLAMMGIEVAFLAGTFWLCIRAQESLKTAISKDKNGTYFMTEKRDFQVVFKGFQSNFLLNQSFYLVYTLRLAAPMIIAAYLYSYIFAQSVLQVSVNAIILLYVVFARPIEKRVNHIQVIVMEVLYLLMNISMLILTSLDKSNKTFTDFGVFLGDMVIFCNFLVNVLMLVFLFVKIMSETRVIRDTIKQNKNSGQIGLWLQLLALPIQQGGMGFEEMIGTHSFSTQYQLLQPQSPPLRGLQPQNRPHKSSIELSSSISPKRSTGGIGEVSPKSQILHRPQFDFDDADDTVPLPSLFYPQATHGSLRFNESFRNTNRRSGPSFQ